ncbi:MAG: GAF domain-containing protein [Vicinamibacteria bacterium]
MTSDELRDAYEERVRRLAETVETRERWLAALSTIAVRTHGCEDVQEILDLALTEILDRLNLKAAWVFMGSQADKKLHFAASKGVSRQYLEIVEREGLDDCLCPEVFWTGHRMQARNTTQCPRMPTIVEGLQERVAHACVPLRFEGQSRGVLNVAARPGEQFSDDELRFLETLGHQICAAIEGAEHLKTERQRNQEARALAAINKAIGGSLDPAVVLKAVGRSAREILGADRVQVFLGDDPSRLIVSHLSGLPHPELKEGQTLNLVEKTARGQLWAFETRSVLQVDDWSRDERFNKALAQRWDMAAAIILPLVARDRTLGLLILSRQAARTWTPSQIEVAESLAAQARIAIENARLYEDSRRSYDQLKGAQERLVENEKMAVLGTFASGLAHEVRNPLNSISLQLAILERRIRRLDSDMSAEMQDLTKVIRGEIDRLDSLVGDFLLFSRTNHLQHAPVSLDDLVDDVLQLVRPEAQSLGIVIKRAGPINGRLRPAPVDPERMKQVILNLLRNAMEAAGAKGVVSVETSESHEGVRLTVSDTGPGFPRDLDIFQSFVTTKPKGTGLGLSVAQQIVSDHGGRITAQSEPGQGASFTITLPGPATSKGQGQ